MNNKNPIDRQTQTLADSKQLRKSIHFLNTHLYLNYNFAFLEDVCIPQQSRITKHTVKDGHIVHIYITSIDCVNSSLIEYIKNVNILTSKKVYIHISKLDINILNKVSNVMKGICNVVIITEKQSAKTKYACDHNWFDPCYVVISRHINENGLNQIGVDYVHRKDSWFNE